MDPGWSGALQSWLMRLHMDAEVKPSSAGVTTIQPVRSAETRRAERLHVLSAAAIVSPSALGVTQVHNTP